MNKLLPGLDGSHDSGPGGRMTCIRQLRGLWLPQILIQIVLFIASAAILDGGFSHAVIVVGIAAHWVLVGVIALRRRNRLSRTDEVIIRAGYVLWSALALAGYVIVYAVRC